MHETRRKGFIMSVMAVGVFAAAALTAGPAPAQTTAAGPYYPTPSWDQKLPAATRFIVLTNWNSEAVLDRETGLVWERSPDTRQTDWLEARYACANKEVGRRQGWRLPAFVELSSLRDPSAPNLTLPAGHPFTNVLGTWYWSATETPATGTHSTDNIGVWVVPFQAFAAISGVGNVNSSNRPYWCVRGAMNASVY